MTLNSTNLVRSDFKCVLDFKLLMTSNHGSPLYYTHFIVVLLYVSFIILLINFVPGTSIFNEHGWWSLSSLVPPDPRSIFSGGMTSKRAQPSSLSPSLTSLVDPPPAKRSRLSLLLVESPLQNTMVASSSQQTQMRTVPDLSGMSSEATNNSQGLQSASSLQPAEQEPESVRLVCVSERQEKVMMQHLLKLGKAVKNCPKASRLLRKLKVRARQRDYGCTPFDLDEIVSDAVSHTLKYVVDEELPYHEQVVPVYQDPPLLLNVDKVNREEEVSAAFNTTPIFTSHGNDILDQLTLIPVLSRSVPLNYVKFEHYLTGELSSTPQSFTSPYTARILKPFIFRTSELTPLKAKLNSEIIRHSLAIKEGANIMHSESPKSIDFCYLQEHHMASVNSLVSRFFWPVDLTECLQYPDFTCVVLYGKLLIGCAFMTPDVKVNEAYISFFLVHPDFQKCGIGHIMLYHLIQSCCGKDVTLHVSVDNPAMLLYQKFGFKAEKFCLDFYERYYPAEHHLSKHAYYMRLRK